MPDQRHAHEQADVGEHAPEHAVGDVVEPGQPEELVGPEQAEAERPLGEEAGRQPARPGEGGEQQRVGPDREAAQQPGHRAGAGGAAPVEAAQDGRRELRHRGEGDEADGHQGVGLAGDPEVDVGQQQDGGDGQPADGDEQPREVAPLVDAQRREPEQHRHDQVVADHGGEGDGLDDDHAAAGREPAQEGQQRQPLGLLGHGHGEHEGVGVDAARRRRASARPGPPAARRR